MSLMSILLIDLQTPQLLTKTTTKVGLTSRNWGQNDFPGDIPDCHIITSYKWRSDTPGRSAFPRRSHPVPGALSPRGWRWEAGGTGSLCCSDKVSFAFAQHCRWSSKWHELFTRRYRERLSRRDKRTWWAKYFWSWNMGLFIDARITRENYFTLFFIILNMFLKLPVLIV